MEGTKDLSLVRRLSMPVMRKMEGYKASVVRRESRDPENLGGCPSWLRLLVVDHTQWFGQLHLTLGHGAFPGTRSHLNSKGRRFDVNISGAADAQGI